MSADPQLPQACQRCFRRKQKCGRQRPICAECERAGAKCVERIWGRPAEAMTADDGVSSRSSIEYLKSRIAFLEQQRTGHTPSAHRRGSSLQTVDHAQHMEGSRNGSLSASYEAKMQPANEVEYLSVAAMGEPERQDPLSTDSFSATMVAEANKLRLTSAIASHIVSDSRLMSEAPLLACQQELQRLCGCDMKHFVNIYSSGAGQMYPCIAADTCQQALNHALGLYTESIDESQLTPMEAAFLTGVITCIGILSSPHYRACTQLVDRIAGSAIERLSMVVGNISDVDEVRYLLLAGQLCLYRFNVEAAWHIVGLAITKAISAGLHRNHEHNEDREDHSILFWTLYKLDRSLALAMGRPLSVEDGDITVQMIQVGRPPHTIMDVRKFFVWTVHYAHMMSGWRRQLPDDLETRISSLAYWKETCIELTRAADTGSSPASSTESTPILMTAVKSQLTCRALTYSLSEALIRDTPSPLPNSVLDQAIQDLEQEIPRFISNYKAAMDASVLGPTVIDTFDVLSVVLVYLAARHMPRRSAIGVATMKLVTSAMEVLQKISERCKAVRSMEELIWAFLSALEKSTLRDDGNEGDFHMTHESEIDQALHAIPFPLPGQLVLLTRRILG